MPKMLQGILFCVLASQILAFRRKHTARVKEETQSVDVRLKQDTKIATLVTDTIEQEYDPKDGVPSHPVAWQAEGYNEVLQWNGVKKQSSWSEVAMKDGPYSTSNVVAMLPNRANLKVLSSVGEYVRVRWLNNKEPKMEGFVKRVNVAQASWVNRKWKAGQGGRKAAWDSMAWVGNGLYNGAAYVGNTAYDAGAATHGWLTDDKDDQVVTTQDAAEKKTCHGVPPYTGNAQDTWCNANCNHVPSHCPATHCSCTAAVKKAAASCQNSNGISGYTFSHNGYWTAGYIAQGRTGSAQECAQKCDGFAGCLGFHFNPISRHCNAYKNFGAKATSRSEAYTKCSQGWFR